MVSIKREDYQMYIKALDDTTRMTHNKLFNDLKSFHQNIHFMQVQMNENLIKCVILLFENIVTVDTDNMDYKHEITKLFNAQYLLLKDMHTNYNNYINQQMET
eukprot:172187_1